MHIDQQRESIETNFFFQNNLVPKIIASSLFLTGIFALVGSLYTWGDGFIFFAPPGTDLTLFVADLIITAPISIIAGYGFWNLHRWGLYLSWFVAGVYIYGSAVVYTMVFQQSPPYPMDLVIPPIFGIIISIGIMLWSWKNQKMFN
ncbi:MAG: hypothetical protein ACW967_09545 [Candidatus Hodarchaeales archaeon]|jgi:hypothetical protein